MRIRRALAVLGALFGVALLFSGTAGAQVLPVSLTLSPTSITPPGIVTGTIVLQNVATTNTLTIVSNGAEAQISSPQVFNGGWLPSCTGQGTASVSCPYTNATYPLTLTFTITVPAGVAPATWSIIATETDTGGASLLPLTILAPPTTTAATTTTAAPVTTTATFGPQSPNPAPPSSTVSWTVTFTRTGPSFVNIGVDLLGTDGQGTLSNFATDTGGSCAATSARGFRCDWQPGDPNTAVVTFTLNIGANPAGTWELDAVLDAGGQSGVVLATQDVVLQQQVTTTAAGATTTTATTATTGSTTTVSVSPTSAANTTDPGSLPVTGQSDDVPFVALIVLALGVFLLLAARKFHSAEE